MNNRTKPQKNPPVVDLAKYPPGNPTRRAELVQARAERIEREKAGGAKSVQHVIGQTHGKTFLGKRAQAELDACQGRLPIVPDFSAPTHERFRAKLAELVKLAKAGNIKALKAFEINPISTSPKAMDRYRNLAVIALEAKAAAAKKVKR